MSEHVLVVKRSALPSLPSEKLFFDGDILSLFLHNAEFIERSEAELNPNYKQLIPYSILRYKGSIFRYKRSAWGGERRLHGLYSIGVGGHINKTDDLPLLALTNWMYLLELARDRELYQEFKVDSISQPRLIGLINDDSSEVGRVHLGVVFEYYLKEPNVAASEKRTHIHYNFTSLTQLVDDMMKYEKWSQIVIQQHLCHNH